MPFRHAAAPIDPNAPLPQFNRQNVTAALVIATLSAGALACVLYAPRWPIPCAIIGLFVTAFAAVLHISLITTTVTVPTVRIVSTLPVHAAEPLPEAEQEMVATGAETVVTVTPDAPRPEQSTDRVAAAVQRAH